MGEGRRRGGAYRRIPRGHPRSFLTSGITSTTVLLSSASDVHVSADGPGQGKGKPRRRAQRGARDTRTEGAMWTRCRRHSPAMLPGAGGRLQ